MAYKATTNRMLRVAVNGCMESLRLVLEVMEGLDVDALDDRMSYLRPHLESGSIPRTC